MAPVNPLLSHLISRLEADVRFLADQGHISPADSQTVLDVFSRAGANVSMNNITGAMSGMGIGNRGIPTGMPTPYGAPSPAPQSTHAPPAFNTPSSTPYNGPENTAPPAFPGGPPTAPAYASTPSPGPGSALKRPVPPPPPPSAGPQCKALWDYNLDGLLKDDLTFRSGDIIQIVKEDNADWWSGRVNGREGMFPANHVEKLPSAPSYGYEEKQHYSQPHHHYAPPPGPAVVYQQGGPVQAAPEEEKKKSGLGKYKSTIASSAAGGLGFGAGAAVGSGIINAIF